MDCSTSLDYDPQSVSIVKFAGYLPPAAEYNSQITIFPGGNCFQEYGIKGDFFLSGTVYQKGKEIGTIHSKHSNQDQNLELYLNDILTFSDPAESTMMVVDYSHSIDIPVELYISYLHRATQSFINYPMLNFMGDILYPTVHATQMENTVFWPGAINDRDTQLSFLIVNPFKLPYQYQFSLFRSGKEVLNSATQRIKPYSCVEHKVDDIFESLGEEVYKLDSEAAICVSAQYKLIANAVSRVRDRQIMTLVDHLHNYILY